MIPMVKRLVMPKDTPMNRARVERLVAAASRYESQILLRSGNKVINGKSMLGLFSLGKVEAPVTLEAEGVDEAEAADAIAALLAE